MSHRDPAVARPAERGFTILELVIAVTIAVEILIGAGIAFDVHNKMARIQTQVTDMQQSLRIAQYDMARLVRMAGRGGLPAEILPTAMTAEFDPANPVLSGLAIEIRNNVGAEVDNADPDRRIARGNESSPAAVAGTDILIVRGCFSNPLYQIDSATFNWDADGDGAADSDAALVIPDPSLHSIAQSLKPMVEEDGPEGGDLVGEWMVLQSPESRQIYGLGQIASAAFDDTDDPTALTLTLNLTATSPLNPVDPVSGVRQFPPAMTVALACLLEEYRYYVREEYSEPGNTDSEMRPRLTRARFRPGTEIPYHGATEVENFRLDLADGIFDLQIALGFDSDNPSADPTTTPGSFDDDIDDLNQTNDDVVFEGARGDALRATDDWLYNDPEDDLESVAWTQHRFPGNTSNPVDLLALRITTLARTARPDPSHSSPDLDGDPAREIFEDNDYEEEPASYFRSELNRKYRHRALTTVVELRNL